MPTLYSSAVRTQRVVDALVSDRIDALFDYDIDTLTVSDVLDHYGVDGAFGSYTYPRDFSMPPTRIEDKGRQLARNALNKAFRQGRVAKVRLSDGRILRDKGQVVFVLPTRHALAERLGGRIEKGNAPW